MKKKLTYIIYSFLALALFCVVNTVSAQVVLPDVSTVTGANVDESGISNIIYVRQNGGDNANDGKSYNSAKQTISAALDVALTDLDAGIKTKILIHPGIYRESVGNVDFSLNDNRKNTPLVIEGTNQAQVVWSGADEYAPSTWASLGNGLYRHNWSYDFGNYTPTFGPQAEVAVRRELVVVNGDMMRQVPLERYTISGGGNFFGNPTPVTYAYTGFDAPATSLSDFSFGVAEKNENGNYIYVKVPVGFNWSSANIEVATRYTLGKFEQKNGLVFREITFKNCANDHNDYGNVGALRFGNTNKCKNIKFENCTFTQNSANGLKPNGKNWTLRNCKFNYNGNSGINSGVEENLLIEHCQFNFNNWRGYAFGDPKGGISWYLAGAKIQGCEGVIVRNSKAIGNHCNGLWYDIHAKNVLTDGFVSLYNRNGISVELSNGPYLINRAILAYQLNNPLNYSILGDVNLTNSILLSNSTKTGGNGKDGAALAIQWYNRTDAHANKELVLAKSFIAENNIIVKENDTDPGQTVFQDIWPAGNKTANYSYKGIDNIYYGVSQNTAFHSSGYGFNPGGNGDLSWWKTVWKVASDNSTWQNPQIVNAPEGDFTLANDSPVKAKENYFLHYKLPQTVATQIGDFFTWTTWGTKTGPMPSGYSGNIAPSVAINYESLHQNQIVENGAGVNIKAMAYDDDGTITKVEFYNGPNYLGEDTTAPYEYNWTSPPSGVNSITARAIDNNNASSDHTVTFEVVGNLPPTISLTSPSNNYSSNEESGIVITADAADQGEGSVTKVAFFADDLLLGEDTTAPYSYQWQGTSARRNIKISAKAYDDSGAVVESEPVYIHTKAVVVDGDTFSLIGANGGGSQALNAMGTNVGAGVNKINNSCDYLMRWVFEDAGNNEWYLKNLESGYYLTADGSTDPADLSLQVLNTSNSLSKWTYTYTGNGWYNLTNVGNGYRLDGNFDGVKTSSVTSYWARAHWELKRSCGSDTNTEVEIEAAADAYVRDGSLGAETYYDNNYGNSQVLKVRYHNGRNHYQSFLKFDLSSISGNIISAKLQLTPVAIGGAATHTLKYNNDSSWSESSIHWNNSRTLITGTPVSSWNTNALTQNVPHEIDITQTLTNYVGNFITFSLQGNLNVPETNYASKENSSSGFTPKLIVEFSQTSAKNSNKSSLSVGGAALDHTDLELHIVPNPASNVIKIQSEPSVLGVKIVNASGKVLFNKNYLGGVKSPAIDISTVSSGLYFIIIKTGKAIITKKLLVNNK